MANRHSNHHWKHRVTRSAWRAASWTLLVLFALFAVLGATGCANILPSPTASPSPASSSSPPPDSAINATAKFLERTVLPANSIFEATLAEETGAGLQARVISTDRRPVPGLSVVNFSLPFAASQILPGRRYAIRARVLVNGQLLFVTEQSTPVLASAQQTTVTILLARPAPQAQQPTARMPGRAPDDAAERGPPPSTGRATEARRDPAASRREAQARAKALAAAQAQAQAEARAQTRARAQAQTQTQTQAKAQADAMALADAQAEAKAQTRARAQAQVRAESQAQAEMQAQSKGKEEAQAQAQAQIEARAKVQAEAKALADAQAQPVAVPAPALAATPVPPAPTSLPAPAPEAAATPAPLLAAVSVGPEVLPRAADPPTVFRGLYRFTANVATFEECVSGARLPVAPEGASVVLEGAYQRLFAVGGNDPAVLATVAGRVLPRPGPDGSASRNTLVVEGFISLGGDACPPAPPAAPETAR